LADAGMDVAITYKQSAEEAAQVVEQIHRMGRAAHAIRVDLADAQADEVVYREFSQRFKRLDALINNASAFAVTPLESMTRQTFENQMAVNARAPLMLIKRFSPMLSAHARVDEASAAPSRGATANAGRIVNFIDIHVMGQPLKGYAAYNASKAALMEITMTMAIELAPKVTVNAIAPGVVSWPEEYTAEKRELYMTRVPLSRPGTPEDVGAAVLYLVRDADYCTGQIIRLDGGRLLT
jgi:pteridine reductase